MISETEIKRAPALRISNVVRGRENAGNRVKYFVDPNGHGIEKAIPEDVVLRRWRRRKLEGFSFHGCRLGPNLWRATIKAFGDDVTSLHKLSFNEIDEQRKYLSGEEMSEHWKLPSNENLTCLLNSISPAQLELIMDRHNHQDHVNRFGVPDLFVFAKRSSADASAAFFRLVEVKRPRERLSKDQQQEIIFLQKIGVPARVLRLMER